MNYAVILAGGVGSRMGIVDKPKQFIDVYGKPILVYTLEAFANHPDVDRIIVVTLKDWEDDVQILIRRYEIDKVVAIVEGGDTRQTSVYAALNYLENISCSEEDIIVVHDAVRPLISQRIIRENIEQAKIYGAIDTVIPSADTIVESKEGKMITTIPKRDFYYLGQTPQSFKYQILKRAHEVAKEDNEIETTDDCKLVLNINQPVHLVQGEKLNFKVTTFEDLLLFKALIKLGNIEVI